MFNLFNDWPWALCEPNIFVHIRANPYDSNILVALGLITQMQVALRGLDVVKDQRLTVI